MGAPRPIFGSSHGKYFVSYFSVVVPQVFPFQNASYWPAFFLLCKWRLRSLNLPQRLREIFCVRDESYRAVAADDANLYNAWEQCWQIVGAAVVPLRWLLRLKFSPYPLIYNFLFSSHGCFLVDISQPQLKVIEKQ